VELKWDSITWLHLPMLKFDMFVGSLVFLPMIGVLLNLMLGTFVSHKPENHSRTTCLLET
jgi:hypothetical protein